MCPVAVRLAAVAAASALVTCLCRVVSTLSVGPSGESNEDFIVVRRWGIDGVQVAIWVEIQPYAQSSAKLMYLAPLHQLVFVPRPVASKVVIFILW